MKILTISNCPLVESQGSGYAIVNFSRGLQARGHRVDLFGPDAFEPFYPAIKAKTYRQALGMLFFTLKQLSKKQYDVVEFYGAESWLTASVLNKIPNRSFLLTSHSNGIENHSNEVMKQHFNSTTIDASPRKWYHLDQSFLLKKAFTQVDGIVTVSAYDRNYALKHHYKDENYLAAIEPGLIDYCLNIDVDYNRKPIVGFCGSWLARKGIQLIQQDISQLLTNLPECLFKLIGVGNNFVKESFFPTDVCDKIEVVPFVDDKRDLLKLYQSLSILIVPSVYESFGLVTAEGMACGCTIVACNTGFAASLKHKEEAWILEKPASPLLYEAVKELLMNEQLRVQIAKAGYKRVQNLQWSIAIERLEKNYQKWLQELRQK